VVDPSLVLLIARQSKQAVEPLGEPGVAEARRPVCVHEVSEEARREGVGGVGGVGVHQFSAMGLAAR
jgi:hypothetical protein